MSIQPTKPAPAQQAADSQRRGRWELFQSAVTDQQSALAMELTTALKTSASGIAPEFWRGVLLNVVREQPELVTECDPQSFLAAVRQTAQNGLMPDKRSGHVYWLPFFDSKAGHKKVNFILGYKGMIELARRSKGVANIVAEVVHAGDDFDYHLGLHPDLRHKPARAQKAGREIEYAYAVCTFKDGTPPVFRVLDRGEIESFRNRSKAKNSGPWVTDYAAMAMKTAVRRLEPWIPLDNPIRRALEAAFSAEDQDLEPRDVDTENVNGSNFAAALAQRLAAPKTPQPLEMPPPSSEEIAHPEPEVKPEPKPRPRPKPEPSAETFDPETGEIDDGHDESPLGKLFPEARGEESVDPERKRK